MSSSSWIDLDALWKIAALGVLLGAGLPALFAIGLRALGPGSGASAASTVEATEGGGQPAAAKASGTMLGGAIAVLCFAVVLAVIGWGVYKIVNPG